VTRRRRSWDWSWAEVWSVPRNSSSYQYGSIFVENGDVLSAALMSPEPVDEYFQIVGRHGCKWEGVVGMDIEWNQDMQGR